MLEGLSAVHIPLATAVLVALLLPLIVVRFGLLSVEPVMSVVLTPSDVAAIKLVKCYKCKAVRDPVDSDRYVVRCEKCK